MFNVSGHLQFACAQHPAFSSSSAIWAHSHCFPHAVSLDTQYEGDLTTQKYRCCCAKVSLSFLLSLFSAFHLIHVNLELYLVFPEDTTMRLYSDWKQYDEYPHSSENFHRLRAGRSSSVDSAIIIMIKRVQYVNVQRIRGCPDEKRVSQIIKPRLPEPEAFINSWPTGKPSLSLSLFAIRRIFWSTIHHRKPYPVNRAMYWFATVSRARCRCGQHSDLIINRDSGQYTTTRKRVILPVPMPKWKRPYCDVCISLLLQ